MRSNANTTSGFTKAALMEHISHSKASVLWSLALSSTAIIVFTWALMFVAISWIKIPQWRQFKNYIFLNLIIAMLLMNAVYTGCFADWPCSDTVLTVVFSISMSAFSNWVLVMCLVIYTKILKVFSGDLQHKYCKANALAWGLAILVSTFPLYLKRSMDNGSNLFVVHAMTYVIVGIYLSIIYALLKLTTVRMVSTENTTQIIKIFFYVTSAFCILILTQALYYFPEVYDYLFMSICGCEIILVVSYLSMKSHWEIWDDYMKGKVDVDHQDCNINLKLL
ncbi:uncharacterized protein LOC125236052 [Leguminivora glycinivorella]|uniref:uncharacterized protein LOC125236052 n=1 Tax=Leguminivora glycinivorella TaxID=1035111 RepID=UPI00200E58CF|nr:uncharacterized protein LOC125236052 [Leguminivora glycinivorella]